MRLECNFSSPKSSFTRYFSSFDIRLSESRWHSTEIHWLLSLGQLCPCPSQTGQHLVTLGLVYTEAALRFSLVSRTMSTSCRNCFSVSGYGEASSSKSEDTTRCSLHLWQKYQTRSQQQSTHPVSSKETKRNCVFYTADPREGFVRFQFRRQGTKLHVTTSPEMNTHTLVSHSLLLSVCCRLCVNRVWPNLLDRLEQKTPMSRVLLWLSRLLSHTHSLTQVRTVPSMLQVICVVDYEFKPIPTYSEEFCRTFCVPLP